MNGKGTYPLGSYPSYTGRGFGNDVERPKTRTEIDLENATLQRVFGLTPSGAGGFQGGIQTGSLKGSLATGKPPTMMADGKKYTLQEDTQKYNRIMAGEREAARRSNRPVQDIMPMYRYVDEQGKPFKGTFLGGGSYGGFGGGSEKRPKPPTPPPPPPPPPKKPPFSDGGPQPSSEQPAPKPKAPPMPTGSYMSDQYGYGFTSQPLGFSGEPASFTTAGSAIGMRPKPTATSTPPPFPEFDTRDYLGGTGFGGIPRFPYSNY